MTGKQIYGLFTNPSTYRYYNKIILSILKTQETPENINPENINLTKKDIFDRETLKPFVQQIRKKFGERRR